MKRLFLLPMLVLILIFSLNSPVAAQSPKGPPYDWQAHPPIHFKPNATTSPTGLFPDQVRTAYGFDQLTANGAGQTIAIIDAYDAPTIENDLQTFINRFGGTMTIGTPGSTTPPNTSPWFQKIYAQGSKPRTNSGWALEVSLDVEWAHAIAPGANILLVEAASNSFSNLMGAVDVAVNSGAHVVSMSWGGSDFSGEPSYDYHFNKNGVVFTASSGDNGAGVSYPASSPYVLGVGGTTLQLGSDNVITSETAWSGSGGGISSYESEPSYQSSYPIPSTGGKRGVPDVSYNADPNTGFSVYDSTSYLGQSGWWQVGGTSAGAPQWAALTAIANQSRSTPLSGSNLNSSEFYNAAASVIYAANYRDITSGSNGTGDLYTAKTGYDFVTGLGSPKANNLVPFLAGSATLPLAISNLTVSPNPFSPNNDGTKDTTTISFRLNKAASWTISVGGKTFTGNTSGATTVSEIWDGKNGSNTVVQDSTYPVDVTANSGPESSSASTTVIVDTTAPVLSSISAGSITGNSASITWTTDELADSLVEYGTVAGTYTNSASSSQLVTSHSVGLSGLTASTKYYYRVTSVDSVGNKVASGEQSFTTASVSPDFSISASPSTRSVKSGTTTSYTVTLTSINGYSSTVNLSLQGANGSFAQNPVNLTSGSATSTLTINTNGMKGTYTLTIFGTSADTTTTHSVSVSLKVR